VNSMPSVPKDAKKAAYDNLVASGLEPSPENLLQSSKKKGAPLHEYFYGGNAKEWADYGRYEAARKIIQSIPVHWRVGGRTITTRAVEFVKTPEGGRWAFMRDILSDKRLADAYLEEVDRLLGSARDKLARFRSLNCGIEDEAA